MALALALGRRGLGRVWPNPAVGCVIVKDGRVIGRGWTQDGGRPHAERVALDQAGAAARGATALRDIGALQPHRPDAALQRRAGRGGRRAGRGGDGDPDPRTAGAGIATLRAAGIEVATGILEGEARRDHAGFCRAWWRGVRSEPETGRDAGRADRHGDGRKPLDHRAARAALGAWAARGHDAVMVGAGTARAMIRC
jgi:diaminohydroxyphosphoribosylaminopyrimidine deaminase/5-amino-6-(5-phosphoribosylamino)uracil reductase